MMKMTGYLPEDPCLSISRFNRHLHRYADFPNFSLQTMLERALSGEPSLSTACLFLFAGRCVLIAAARCEAAVSAATAPPRRRSSLAGAFT